MGDAAMNSRDGADYRRPPQTAAKSFMWFERYVLIPLGFLWLVFLCLLALPVMTVMTVLYYLSRIVPRTSRTGRKRRSDRDGAGEPAT
jgi:hypothetical protein